MQWLKDLVDRDNPASTKNALALMAGFCLCVGFLAIVCGLKPDTASITIVEGALVGMALFHKDDIKV